VANLSGLWRVSGLARIYKTRLEDFARKKCSSLYRLFLSDEEKMFYETQTPVVNVIKLFFLVTDEDVKKLERLSPESFSGQAVGAYPRGKSPEP
jgi:hypothetical protein